MKRAATILAALTLAVGVSACGSSSTTAPTTTSALGCFGTKTISIEADNSESWATLGGVVLHNLVCVAGYPEAEATCIVEKLEAKYTTWEYTGAIGEEAEGHGTDETKQVVELRPDCEG
jgi:hypothetical protein